MAILKSTEGAVYIINTSSAFSTEATTEDGSTKVYQIDDEAMRIWDPNYAITVTGGTVDKAWMDRGVDYFTGRVKATAAGLSALTVDGQRVVLQEVGFVHSAQLAISINPGEVTAIGDTWRSLTALARAITLTLSRYRFDTELDTLTPAWVLVKLFEDDTNGYWVKALPTGQQLDNKSVGAVDGTELTLEVSGPISRF